MQRIRQSSSSTCSYFHVCNELSDKTKAQTVRSIQNVLSLQSLKCSYHQSQQKANQMTVIEITDNLRSHFIQAVVLLRMMNSVRDDLMIYNLDQDSHNIDMSREHLLKRKFLDFFALICVTKKNDDSVSATCMKKDASQETVL